MLNACYLHFKFEGDGAFLTSFLESDAFFGTYLA